MKLGKTFLLLALTLILNFPTTAQETENEITFVYTPRQNATDPFAPARAEAARDAADGLEEKGDPLKEPLATVDLKAKVLDQHSGEQLKDIALEVFIISEQGQNRHAFAGTAASGRFSLPLFKDLSHLLIIRRAGYHPLSVLIEGSSADVEKTFYLISRRPDPDRPKRSEIVARPGQPQPVRSSAPQISNDMPAFALATAATDRRTLTGATGLRALPTHQSAVLQRFKTGDVIEVLEKTGKYWWKVHYHGKTGFVKAHMLALPEDGDPGSVFAR